MVGIDWLVDGWWMIFLNLLVVTFVCCCRRRLSSTAMLYEAAMMLLFLLLGWRWWWCRRWCLHWWRIDDVTNQKRYTTTTRRRSSIESRPARLFSWTNRAISLDQQILYSSAFTCPFFLEIEMRVRKCKTDTLYGSSRLSKLQTLFLTRRNSLTEEGVTKWHPTKFS